MPRYLKQRYWHHARRQHRQYVVNDLFLRSWGGELGKREATEAQRFDSDAALQAALDALVAGWLAEGFVEHTADYRATVPQPQRWRGLAASDYAQRLKALGFEPSLKDFRHTLRLWPWEPPEAFELFVASGILGTSKAPHGLLREAIDHGTPAMALALLDALPAHAMDAAYFSRRVMMEAAGDDCASPELGEQWRTLVWRLLDRVDDIDVPYIFRTPLNGGVEEWFTPLQRALDMRDAALVQVLLARGADVHRAYPDHRLLGGTVLHYLCAMRDPDSTAAQHLLQAGAPLEARDDKGRTALGVACANPHGEAQALVQCLIRHGAEVRAAQDPKDDSTALTLCLRRGYYAVAHTLLDSVEEWPRTQSATWSPLALAMRDGQEALARKIHRKGGYRPMLGIGGNPDPDGGLKVDSVREHSGAALAGLRPGDLVRRAEGQPVASVQALAALVYAMPPGQPLRLLVESDGASREVVVPVGAY